MSRRVLVVDDSLTVRMELVELFEASGFEVVGCATGAQARQALAEDRFDLVALDVMLPDADGIEMLAEIKAQPAMATVPVMLLSSEAELQDRIRGLKTGADEYIGKPYDPNYVVARANELTRRETSAAASDDGALLLIDDSLTFREAVKAVLEDAGYAVAVADSGEEGLRLAAQMRPMAIVVDGELPGIDGPTVIQRIRLDAALRRVPCLLLTASGEEGAEVRALAAGADAFLRKSDDFALMLAKLKAMLRVAGAGSAKHDTASLMGPKRILAVDDSETHLQGLTEALRRDSYHVVTAHSGEEALELLALQPVDCILLDLIMPGMGGLETCRRLKASADLREVPVVMLTGTDDYATMIEALAAGADDFISKSGDFTVLQARIVAQLRRKQFEDEKRAFHEQLLRKELEASEALRRAQKIEALGQLTGGIAHDFNNLLGVIVGNLDLLADTPSDDPMHAELLQDAVNAALRGSELTSRLLAFARQQPLSTRAIDLNGVLSGTIAMLRRTLGEGVRIQTSLAPDLWTALADPSQVEDAVLNLAINARDAMPGGGEVTIETANIRLDERYPSVPTEVAPGDYVTLSVTDTGVGMPPEVIERAIEPFFTTKPMGKGTGLGLSMIYGFAKQSNGHLSIYSQVGVGTTIRLYLPRLTDGAREDDGAGAAVQKPGLALTGGNESILVVDDNVQLRQVAVRRLTELGYRCREADNGPAALALMDQGVRFDLLFTDVGLPEGMLGTELAEQAIERQPWLKVLFTTGYAKGLGGGERIAGVRAVVMNKPYRGSELAEKVRSMLDSV